MKKKKKNIAEAPTKPPTPTKTRPPPVPCARTPNAPCRRSGEEGGGATRLPNRPGSRPSPAGLGTPTGTEGWSPAPHGTRWCLDERQPTPGSVPYESVGWVGGGGAPAHSLLFNVVRSLITGGMPAETERRFCPRQDMPPTVGTLYVPRVFIASYTRAKHRAHVLSRFAAVWHFVATACVPIKRCFWYCCQNVRHTWAYHLRLPPSAAFPQGLHYLLSTNNEKVRFSTHNPPETPAEPHRSGDIPHMVPALIFQTTQKKTTHKETHLQRREPPPGQHLPCLDPPALLRPTTPGAAAAAAASAHRRLRHKRSRRGLQRGGDGGGVRGRLPKGPVHQGVGDGRQREGKPERPEEPAGLVLHVRSYPADVLIAFPLIWCLEGEATGEREGKQRRRRRQRRGKERL